MSVSSSGDQNVAPTPPTDNPENSPTPNVIAPSSSGPNVARKIGPKVAQPHLSGRIVSAQSKKILKLSMNGRGRTLRNAKVVDGLRRELSVGGKGLDCFLYSREGLRMKVHKAVLMQSPHLHRILTSVLCCKGQCLSSAEVVPHIFLPDVSQVHLRIVLCFLYNGVLMAPPSEIPTLKSVLFDVLGIPPNTVISPIVNNANINVNNANVNVNNANVNNANINVNNANINVNNANVNNANINVNNVVIPTFQCHLACGQRFPALKLDDHFREELKKALNSAFQLINQDHPVKCVVCKYEIDYKRFGSIPEKKKVVNDHYNGHRKMLKKWIFKMTSLKVDASVDESTDDEIPTAFASTTTKPSAAAKPSIPAAALTTSTKLSTVAAATKPSTTAAAAPPTPAATTPSTTTAAAPPKAASAPPKAATVPPKAAAPTTAATTQSTTAATLAALPSILPATPTTATAALPPKTAVPPSAAALPSTPAAAGVAPSSRPAAASSSSSTDQDRRNSTMRKRFRKRKPSSRECLNGNSNSSSDEDGDVNRTTPKKPPSKKRAKTPVESSVAKQSAEEVANLPARIDTPMPASARVARQSTEEMANLPVRQHTPMPASARVAKELTPEIANLPPAATKFCMVCLNKITIKNMFNHALSHKHEWWEEELRKARRTEGKDVVFKCHHLGCAKDFASKQLFVRHVGGPTHDEFKKKLKEKDIAILDLYQAEKNQCMDKGTDEGTPEGSRQDSLLEDKQKQKQSTAASSVASKKPFQYSELPDMSTESSEDDRSRKDANEDGDDDVNTGAETDTAYLPNALNAQSSPDIDIDEDLKNLI